MSDQSKIQIATLTELESHLVQTLLYFDIFSYPLTAQELQRCSRVPGLKLDEVHQTADQLVAKGYIRQEGIFYYLGNDLEKIDRRVKGNEEAERRIPKAFQVSKFIGKFPYVRAVMLSGSLSKNYMEKDSDIDYFIVTKPGRLWICRTLLILYKKLILLNSHRNFCVNYFVDEDHLKIEDKNSFTATEVSFLLPSYNYQLYQEFRAKNSWSKDYYPNYGLRNDYPCPEKNNSWIRRSLEWVLNSGIGERLDTWCMKRTLKRWRTKFPDFDEDSFEVALRSRKYVSKHHPRRFQDLVGRKLVEKRKALEEQFKVRLYNS